MLPLFAVALALTAPAARAQAPAVHVEGLLAPTRVLVTKGGRLLVAESGGGPNAGRVSIVDPDGTRRTLVDGLPSGLSGEGAPSGPSGLAMVGRTLYVTIGTGDAVTPGAVPGTELPNPSPSSPIFSSVISVKFSARVERTTGGLSLTPADHATLKGGGTVRLRGPGAGKAVVRLVADFADFTAAPRPGAPDNVRASNPFGVEVDGKQIYVVDASQNTLLKIDGNSGEVSTLLTFEPIPNPLPFGPPASDYVPESVRASAGGLLVTNLTGFPFPQGAAEVRRVDASAGTAAPLISGLTAAIDVLAVSDRGGAERYYVLEFSANMLADPAVPGRLLRFDTPDGAPTVIADALVSPVGMARDPGTGDIFIAEMFAGRVVKITGQ